MLLPKDNPCWQAVYQCLESLGYRVDPLCKGWAVIQNKDGKTRGLVGASGRVVVQCHYDDIRPFSETRARVCKNGLWGFINEDGHAVIGLQYDYVTGFSKGRAWVTKNGEGFWIGPDGSRLD